MLDKVRFALIGDATSVRRAAQIVETAGKAEVVAIFSDKLVACTGRFPHATILSGNAVNTPAGREVVDRTNADWLLSVGNFDHLIGIQMLERFEGRAVNVHLGLLPDYSGRHAYQWAIRNGEQVTGTTLHKMTTLFDGGAILGVHKEVILPFDTGLSVYKRCVAGGFALLSDLVGIVTRGAPLVSLAQDLSRRRAYLDKDVGDGRIDWAASAEQVRDFVRASNFLPFRSPSYTAWFEDDQGLRREVFEVETIDDTALGLLGKAQMDGDQMIIQCGRGRVRIVRTKLAPAEVDPNAEESTSAG